MRFWIVTIMLVLSATMYAEETDTVKVKGWGASVSATPGRISTMDREIKELVQRNGTFTLGGQIRHVSLPTQRDPYAQDFGYPTFAFGVNYNFYNRVRLHRGEETFQGMGQPVGYQTKLGNSLAAYASFERALLRNEHWEADYAINIGLGFSDRKYDRVNQIDNLMISSNVLIFFGATLSMTYRFAKDWGLRAGIDFSHLSTGTLKRPNKGSNVMGPTLGIVYYPYYDELLKKNLYKTNHEFEKTKYWNLTASAGLCTLYEDWMQTQYKTPIDDPDYRINDFKRYAVYTFSADYMSRYARRWASGGGIDIYYLSYMDRVKDLDRMNDRKEHHSPLSVGVSAKHEVYYHNLSLSMSLGLYVFRQTGKKAKDVEQPFYETVGLRYHFPQFYGIAVGAYVRAHAFKADHTGISLSCPIQIHNK